MPRFERRDLECVRALQSYARTIDLDGKPLFQVLVPALRDALGTSAFLAYGVRQFAAENQELTFTETTGLVEPHFSESFRRYVARQSVVWGSYNPGRPEPTQRNRVIAWSHQDLEKHRAPIYVDLYPDIGLHGLDQLRVLVCEGPSLLGWLGGWQSSAFEPRQTAMLRALVPSLRRRLVVERQLAQGGAQGRLDAALEAIGRCAFVVDLVGRIAEANSPARAALDDDAPGVRGELLDAIRSRADHPRWSITPVRCNGAAVEYLAVERIAASTARTHVALAAEHWQLTKRQRAVLEKVVEGNANQTIAAMLGISERTVEVHVTALLEKAQVENRAALVAKVFTRG